MLGRVVREQGLCLLLSVREKFFFFAHGLRSARSHFDIRIFCLSGDSRAYLESRSSVRVQTLLGWVKGTSLLGRLFSRRVCA